MKKQMLLCACILLLTCVICLLYFFFADEVLTTENVVYSNAHATGEARMYRDGKGRTFSLDIASTDWGNRHVRSWVSATFNDTPYRIANIQLSIQASDINQIDITDNPSPYFVQANLNGLEYKATKDLTHEDNQIRVEFESGSDDLNEQGKMV